MLAMPPLSITIVSDVVCPWCLIGSRRLDLALASMPEVAAEIRYRPFLLEPGLPPAGVDLRDNLRRKFGDPEPMFRRVEAAAREDGIPLDFSKISRFSNTIGAHTLLRLAAERGTQRALSRAFFQAYFIDGQDVGSPEILAAVASSHGFTADEARALCEDENERRLTRQEAQKASAEGVSGVPFFTLAGRYSFSGAQPVDTFRKMIARALAGG